MQTPKLWVVKRTLLNLVLFFFHVDRWNGEISIFSTHHHKLAVYICIYRFQLIELCHRITRNTKYGSARLLWRSGKSLYNLVSTPSIFRPSRNPHAFKPAPVLNHSAAPTENVSADHHKFPLIPDVILCNSIILIFLGIPEFDPTSTHRQNLGLSCPWEAADHLAPREVAGDPVAPGAPRSRGSWRPRRQPGC